MIIVPPCAVVVTPVEGRVRSLVPAGTMVGDGEVVAVVENSHGTADLRAPVAGEVRGFLADQQQSVARGEGVVWLSRH